MQDEHPLVWKELPGVFDSLVQQSKGASPRKEQAPLDQIDTDDADQVEVIV